MQNLPFLISLFREFLQKIDRIDELKVIKLKGNLITKGFTKIIYISEENEDFVLDYILKNNRCDQYKSLINE